MHRPRLAIVVAMEQEVRPLLRTWRSREVDAAAVGSGRRLKLFESEHALMIIGGIGAKAAARAARIVLDLGRACTLISAGSAGALKSELKVGQVLRPSTVIDETGNNRFSVQGGTGTLVTAGSIVGPGEKARLASLFSADAVDMEAAAVAAVAQERRVEFLAIKSVSDELDCVLPPMGQFVDDEGRFHTGRFLGYVAVRPRWWGAVNRMAADSARAATALSEAIERLRTDVKNRP